MSFFAANPQICNRALNLEYGLLNRSSGFAFWDCACDDATWQLFVWAFTPSTNAGMRARAARTGPCLRNRTLSTSSTRVTCDGRDSRELCSSRAVIEDRTKPGPSLEMSTTTVSFSSGRPDGSVSFTAKRELKHFPSRAATSRARSCTTREEPSSRFPISARRRRGCCWHPAV